MRIAYEGPAVEPAVAIAVKSADRPAVAVRRGHRAGLSRGGRPWQEGAANLRRTAHRCV